MKYIIEHVGRPMTTVPPEAWKKLSTHASLRAAWLQIVRYSDHLPMGCWDDHYRIKDSDGNLWSYDPVTKLGRIY